MKLWLETWECYVILHNYQWKDNSLLWNKKKNRQTWLFYGIDEVINKSIRSSFGEVNRKSKMQEQSINHNAILDEWQYL